MRERDWWLLELAKVERSGTEEKTTKDTKILVVELAQPLAERNEFTGIETNLKRLPAAGRVPFAGTGDDTINDVVDDHAIDSQHIGLPCHRSIRGDPQYTFAGCDQ